MYTEEDLINSLVIDKEGYVCGYIRNFNVESDKIIINIYDVNSKDVEVVAEEEFIQKLMSLFSKDGMFQKNVNIESLHQKIREKLGLSSTESVTLEHLISYANSVNIKIPMQIQNIREEIEKYPVVWSSIDKIAFTDLGKCVLLKESIEAEKRGIILREKVEYKSTRDLAGKIVLDSEARKIGSVTKFLFGNSPGIMVALEKKIEREVRPDIESLRKLLIPSRFKDEKELIAQVKKDLKIGNLNDYGARAILIWAKKNNIDVQNKPKEQIEALEEIPVDWSEIGKIGDVVILKQTVDKLKENKSQILNSV
ncbi:MAG: hypothetical protein QG670_20 [Thermoproteota archaeon]|nr:hypothetical protein [Thermoproteota archaeon]